jgi:hypothetical protein
VLRTCIILLEEYKRSSLDQWISNNKFSFGVKDLKFEVGFARTKTFCFVSENRKPWKWLC